jgi:hypothetical protein
MVIKFSANLKISPLDINAISLRKAFRELEGTEGGLHA